MENYIWVGLLAVAGLALYKYWPRGNGLDVNGDGKVDLKDAKAGVEAVAAKVEEEIKAEVAKVAKKAAAKKPAAAKAEKAAKPAKAAAKEKPAKKAGRPKKSA